MRWAGTVMSTRGEVKYTGSFFQYALGPRRAAAGPSVEPEDRLGIAQMASKSLRGEPHSGCYGFAHERDVHGLIHLSPMGRRGEER